MQVRRPRAIAAVDADHGEPLVGRLGDPVLAEHLPARLARVVTVDASDLEATRGPADGRGGGERAEVLVDRFSWGLDGSAAAEEAIEEAIDVLRPSAPALVPHRTTPLRPAAVRSGTATRRSAAGS
ncbi:hypothetical protein [Streptomyces sp. NBC_01276]|uniref:hypothetical protein n=1 Tax=Streptomyces sp. NBC_01276 TaxID=2903808 RepID=UPI00352F834C